MADDLGGLVALETLGAGVPAGHPSVGVEHVDGVVGDRVDQQAIAAVIGLQSLEAVHPTPTAPGAGPTNLSALAR
jgi:hypothetical protein